VAEFFHLFERENSTLGKLAAGAPPAGITYGDDGAEIGPRRWRSRDHGRNAGGRWTLVNGALARWAVDYGPRRDYGLIRCIFVRAEETGEAVKRKWPGGGGMHGRGGGRRKRSTFTPFYSLLRAGDSRFGFGVVRGIQEGRWKRGLAGTSSTTWAKTASGNVDDSGEMGPGYPAAHSLEHVTTCMANDLFLQHENPIGIGNGGGGHRWNCVGAGPRGVAGWGILGEVRNELPNGLTTGEAG